MCHHSDPRIALAVVPHTCRKIGGPGSVPDRIGGDSLLGFLGLLAFPARLSVACAQAGRLCIHGLKVSQIAGSDEWITLSNPPPEDS